MIEAEHLFCDRMLGELEPGLKSEVERVRAEIESGRDMPAYEVVAAERHHLALKIAEETSRVVRGKGVSWDKRIDAVIMHPFYGYVILVAVFMAFFLVIFKIGNPLEGLLFKPFAALSLDLKAAPRLERPLPPGRRARPGHRGRASPSSCRTSSPCSS